MNTVLTIGKEPCNYGNSSECHKDAVPHSRF